MKQWYSVALKILPGSKDKCLYTYFSLLDRAPATTFSKITLQYFTIFVLPRQKERRQIDRWYSKEVRGRRIGVSESQTEFA